MSNQDLGHPDNFPVGYDRGHKATCEWPDCPGGTDCEGISDADREAAANAKTNSLIHFITGGDFL